MAIILISSRFEEGGKELAESLAKKTGWPLAGRRELQDEARELGIRTGRLEMSIIKAPQLSERIAHERNLYLAFLTARLCEMGQDGNLIYYGRAGHLLLPGVSHRLRVGLTMPHGVRVERTSRTLNLSPPHSESYLRQLDQDFEKWVKVMHRVDGNDPGQYDIFLNLEHLGLSNAAGLVCEMSGLADFRPTPRSTKLVEDMRLAARARLSLALDERTAAIDLQVQADDGVLTVTYPPSRDEAERKVPQVLQDLDGCRTIHCTMADTNILWVQERFEPSSEGFRDLTQLARRWGAALELMRLIPEDEEAAALPAANAVVQPGPRRHAEDGGVEDDTAQPVEDDGGLRRTHEELVSIGRSAGQRTVCGGYERILEAAQDSNKYSLVVIGDIFLSKGASARTRLTRELALAIRDRLKAPVITANELQEKFMFGRKQALKLVVSLSLVVAVYLLVFNFQEPVLSFLGGDFHHKWRWLTPIGVALFVPIVAYLYGTVSGLALKLINID